jgi:ribosome-binding protein aMBF1 (putative translation factor)
MIPKSAPAAVNLARDFAVSQTELLEIFAVRFGGALRELVAIECGPRPRRRTIRQWVRNNTSTPRRQVAHAIAVTRHRKGWSQQQLADALEWPHWLIADIEHGRAYCHSIKARQVAKVLECSNLDRLLDHYNW